jgi:ubiquinone/menaquinone biosynthesis C-methylase UbiE
MTKLKKDIFNIKFDSKDLVRKLNIKEINIINHKYKLSFFFRLRRGIKILTFNIRNFFSLNKTNLINSRSLESVKKKYDGIAGQYVREYISSKNNYFCNLNSSKDLYLIKGNPKKYYAKYLFNIIDLFKVKSLLEVGAGELTLLYDLIKNLKKNKKYKKKEISAVDISYYRLLAGKNFLKKKRISIEYLIKADGANLPLQDNSIDLVFTSHCLEQVPNISKKIISELIRVSRKYVVLIEPSYDFGSQATRNRIFAKGYTKINEKILQNISGKVILRELIPYSSHLNNAELIIIKKKQMKSHKNKLFCCPVCKKSLRKSKNKLLCDKDNIYFNIESKINLLTNSDAKNSLI